MTTHSSRLVSSVCSSLLILGLLSLSGCGKGGGPKTVPVSGTVTYKGAPLPGAHVTFLGDGKILPAMALTDSNGEFSLTTSTPGDGAVPGNHQVTVSKQLPGAKKASGPEDTSMDAMVKKAHEKPEDSPQSLSMIPEHYANASTSGLTFKVEEGKTNNFKIELKD